MAESAVVTDYSTDVATVTSCETTVTECPASTKGNATISTYEAGAGTNKVAGVAALAAGALLAL